MTQSRLDDWLLNIDQPAGWALLLLAVVVIAFVVILIWRRKRRPAFDGSISRGANDEKEYPFNDWSSPNEQASPSHDAFPKAGE